MSEYVDVDIIENSKVIGTAKMYKGETKAEKGLEKRLGTMGYLNIQNVQKPYTDGFTDGMQEREKEIAELKRNKKTVAHLAGCLEKKMKERIEELERLNSNQAESLRVTMLEEEKKGKRIAELKAGKPQWHDLRKDPNDLPPKMLGNSNFSIDVLSDKGEIVCYNFHYCEWFYWRSGSPIAWCEIPTFDKE